MATGGQPPKLASLLEPETSAAPSRSRVATGGDGLPKSTIIKVALCGLAIVVAAVLIFRSVGGGGIVPDASVRPVIDSETGEVLLRFPIRDGMQAPFRNPRTGTSTLYPAVPCYWNADGTAKLEPTWVFVKSLAGQSGDTLCPDCGRRVIPHNPMPPDELMLQALERHKAGAGGS